ncbi:MAG: hypothetical protein NE328_12180 [Lentisphaeraceae bacterium]|nr:hypothetical protein [Lentisphaeraceae bacterium]
MKKFISRQKAEEALSNCLYEIKDILNKDLSTVKLRNRTCCEWLKQFGRSELHLKTKRKLQQLEELKLRAETYILLSMNKNTFKSGNSSLEETWIN